MVMVGFRKGTVPCSIGKKKLGYRKIAMNKPSCTKFPMK